MKQYAILKDILLDTTYGVAVRDGGVVEYFGLNEQSCQWADWANQKSINSLQIPDGVSLGEFCDLTEEVAKQLNFKIGVSESIKTKSIESQISKKLVSGFVFMESKSLANHSKTPSVSDIPLRMFGETKPLVIAFKIATFKSDVLRSEIALKSRFNQLAFNLKNNKFNPRPNSNFKNIEFDRLNRKSSTGSQRRFGKKITEQINSNISFVDTEEKWPGEFISGFLLGRLRRRKKRKKLSFKSSEILDFHQKGIGRAIGGGIGGAARRASIPNSGGRGGRGVASRVITGVTDPSKRRDVDGDGMIFDGTWREMPDPTRFKPNERARKPFSPDPNKPIGSQSLQIIEENEKRRGDLTRMLEEASRSDVDRFRDPYGQGRMREIVEQDKRKRRAAEMFRQAENRGLSSQATPTESESSQERGVRLLKRDFKTPEEELESVNQSLEMGERAPIGSQSLRLREFNAEQEMLKKRKKYLENLIQRGGKYEPDKGPGLKKEKDENSIESLVRKLQNDGVIASGAPKIRGVRSQSSPSFTTSRRKLGELPTDVRSFLGRLKDKYPSQALFRELEDGVISDTNRRAALDFLDDIENRYQGQDNQSPSVTTRPIGQKDRIAAAHLAKIIARTGDNYKEENFNPIKGIDYSPIEETAPTAVGPSQIKPELRRGVRSQSSQNSSSRRAIATTERAATPRGLASQSSPKTSGRRRPGVDKVDPSDGKLWESLTPEQKKKTIEALQKSRDEITEKFKKVLFKSWWNDQVRGAKKQSILGGRFKPRGNDEKFNPGDITEMQRLLDLDKSIAPATKQKVQKQIDALSLINRMEANDDFSLLEQLHPAQKGAILKALSDDPSFKPVKGFTKVAPSTIYGAGGGLSKETVKAANAVVVDEKQFIRGLLEAARGANDATEPLLLKISKNKKLTADEEEELLNEFTSQPETQKKLKAILDARKKSDKQQVSFRARILRVNPERARKRQLRRQRASGQARRNPIILDPAMQIKKKKLRSAAFRRQILSKFRKTKNAEELSDSLGERKVELHPVVVSADGKVTITPQFANIMSLLDEKLADKKTQGSKAYDKLLATLWENFGYSETPVLVTKEEVQNLLDAGWQPIIRGTGNQAVESESYVEQFLTSPGRFIPGQGARAYGVGEYFAFPGGNWTGYSGGAEDRHSMLVLIPPTAKIMTSRELNNERQDMANQSTLIHNEFVTAGGRQITEAMTPGELAQMARKGAPKLAESKTISGQILNQLVSRLEELENMPGDTNKEKIEILQSLDYLQRFSKNEEVGQFAPIIGVDAIDTNDSAGSGSPMLLHNRSIIAAFQTPMTRKDAEEMSSGVVKTWDKWKKKNTVSAAADVESPKSTRTKPRAVRRQVQNPNVPAQTSTFTAIPNAVDASSWKSSTPPFTPGSNPAELLTAPDGTQYYAKKPKANEPALRALERMETEVLASKLYKLAGIDVPELSIGDRSGEPRMLSQIMQTRMPNSTSDQDAARAGFVVDAWLANWDAPLNDNIKFDSNNNPIRMDVGGSLDYRAQGGKKETTSTPFGDTVGEIMSMQKNGNINFTNIDSAEIKKQALALSTVADDKIRATVSAIVSDPQRAAKLAQTLINRRDDIVKNYG